MSIETILTELADEHLARMPAVGWAGFAEILSRGGHGETFGCKVDGVYCDVGDRAEWSIRKVEMFVLRPLRIPEISVSSGAGLSAKSETLRFFDCSGFAISAPRQAR